MTDDTRPPDTPPSDRDELQRAYEAIYLAEFRDKTIDSEERNARLTALEDRALAAGLSRQELEAIASTAVWRAADIHAGRTPRAPIPDDVIDLQAMRDRRGEAVDAAWEARHDAFRQQLSEMIATSDITESGMILETLQALLMALDVNDTNLGELKQRIIRTLEMIR